MFKVTKCAQKHGYIKTCIELSQTKKNNQTLALNREVGHKKVEYQMDWPPPSISVHHRQQRILKQPNLSQYHLIILES